MYREHTKQIKIGDRYIGGGNAIAIQSMTNTKTEDVEATVAQILALEKAGCEIIRCAVPTMEAAEALTEIKKQIHIPLVAMTAAETGHLIFSTLHTIGAANTIDRIIDVFPPNQQRQIAVQLSMVLQAVVSQQLVPTVDGRMVPAFEIMTVTPAIRNMIRDNKIPQIDGLIYSSANDELISMDASLLKLYKDQIISKDTALAYASNPEMLKRRL